MASRESCNGNCPQEQNNPQNLNVRVGSLLIDLGGTVFAFAHHMLDFGVSSCSPKVDKNNANTVEGMVHDGCHKRSLSQTHHGVFVETENAVVCLGRDTDNGGIKYVNQ